LLTCAVFGAAVLFARRFLGPFALVACVYVSRDLDAILRPLHGPAWLRPAWTRAALATVCAVLVAAPDLGSGRLPVHVGVPAGHLPVGASDFVARHDLRGRLFNEYDYGGYLCFRFWPRRDQLPFMGIHQEGSQELRHLYMLALSRPESWRELERRFRFDYLVLIATPVTGDDVLGFVERDSSWARVFGDDAAYVFVRRRGPFAQLAADSAYTALPADPKDFDAFGQRTTRDSTLRRRAERELWREVAGSPCHAKALGYLANIALFEGRWDDAQRELKEALRIQPLTSGAREKLGLVALQQGRPREALRWFEEDRRVMGYRGGLSFRRGQVAQAEGDLRRALVLYRQELRRDVGNSEVRDSVESLSRRLGP
jgi:hypothetical protein